MYIKDHIALIDAAIGENLPKDCGVDRWVVKYHGLCKSQWNQNNNSYLLHETTAERDKVTLDTQYDVQIMHVATTVPSIFSQLYGSVTDVSFEYNMKLLCVTTKHSVYERCLKALRQVDDTVYKSANLDTESVMKNDIKIVVGNDKNYPPEYWAFAIYYGVTNIEPIIEDEE